ncbi:hypothetical protein PGT21_025580 [Puccinia graminis f. sp. tritici]|uniref:Uncharacterized protein n=1 Tax=Puccinia graminis f. sp. tritici TaxID=56615 RepID=A0A5B0RUK9_PUCGR|nr:hypothetical protein PGT21_023872 [Puccinia graminis f. sp. tritici]KAA1108783.1 hypothetical protein PGT21_025580 [Puccinia graminis f. sp. tritici]KAA1129068.1 hypothetical protein PGTUg99_027503 [Puccinia graminis f. sp. tritici]
MSSWTSDQPDQKSPLRNRSYRRLSSAFDLDESALRPALLLLHKHTDTITHLPLTSSLELSPMCSSSPPHRHPIPSDWPLRIPRSPTPISPNIL